MGEGKGQNQDGRIFTFLLTYSAVSSVSHWAENKRGFAHENTRGERRERQRHSMRKESLSKQPHKVRSYQASMKEEVEWEKLVDSTVAFACLKRLPRHREDGWYLVQCWDSSSYSSTIAIVWEYKQTAERQHIPCHRDTHLLSPALCCLG